MLCYMIKVFRSFYGEKLPTPLCMSKTDAHIKLWTLDEVFTSKKPDVSHFRIFGCSIYFHAPKEKRNKLNAPRKKGTFMGYNETSKAYKIYVSGQREVTLFHNVTFDEDSSLRKI